MCSCRLQALNQKAHILNWRLAGLGHVCAWSAEMVWQCVGERPLRRQIKTVRDRSWDGLATTILWNGCLKRASAMRSAGGKVMAVMPWTPWAPLPLKGETSLAIMQITQSDWVQRKFKLKWEENWDGKLDVARDPELIHVCKRYEFDQNRYKMVVKVCHQRISEMVWGCWRPMWW